MAKQGGSTVQPGQGNVATIANQATDRLTRVEAGATKTDAGNPLDAVLVDDTQGANPSDGSQNIESLSILDDIQGETHTDPYAEERAKEELRFEGVDPDAEAESQRVKAMSEREESERWQYRQPQAKVETDPSSPDGGYTDRILGIAQNVANSQVEDHALTFSPGSNLGKIAVGLGAVTNPGQQNIQLDDNFRYAVAIHAEKYFADQMEGVKSTLTPMSTKEQVEAEENASPNLELKKATDSSRLGMEIARDFLRENNLAAGLPSDAYSDISKDQATVLGDYAKELYAMSMGSDKIIRDVDDDGMVVFTLTPAMVAELDASRQARKIQTPSMEVIKPTHTKPEKGRLQGEKGKYTKEVAGALGKGVASSKAAQESLENQASIPHGVRPRRLQLLMGTLLPALMAGPQQFNNPLVEMAAEINGFGSSKYAALKIAEQIKQSKGEYYDINSILRMMKQGAAEELRALVEGRNQANFQTFYTQAFASRQSPQQTHFNLTTSKIVRGATANVVPTMVKKDGKYFDAAIQAFAMLIGENITYGEKDVGLDAYLPEFRVNFLRTQAPMLAEMGRTLKEVLNQSFSEGEVDAMYQAIEQGKPINDPSFPKPKLLRLDPQKHSELIRKIKDKGEDGIAYMDALMEFAEFMDAMKAGRSFPLYINPTIDGKTNGIASNALQMGTEAAAIMTGVLRSPDAIHAVENDHDIRDELETILKDNLRRAGFAGSHADGVVPALTRIAESVFGYRPLNKEITMTFGYGKEIDSFINSINEAVYSVSDKDPQVKKAAEFIRSTGMTDQEVANIVLQHYIPAMEMVMSPEAIEARAMHRGVALIHGLADTLMYYNNPVGDPLYMGGKRSLGAKKVGSYKMLDNEGNQVQRTANKYESESTSAAVKMRKAGDRVWEDVGGKAFSGAVVAPIQSIDAATVIKSFSGKSWDMLTSNVKQPYMHQIYDAFKMDVATYHHMMPEINNNWAQTAITWSALEQGIIALNSRALPALREKLKSFSANDKIDLEEHFPLIADMMQGSFTKNGANYMGLKSRLKFLYPRGHKKSREQWVEDAIYQIVGASGFSIGQKYATKAEIGYFVQALLNETQLKPRINRLYKKTQDNRAKLKPKIFGKGNHIYQYYAH